MRSFVSFFVALIWATASLSVTAFPYEDGETTYERDDFVEAVRWYRLATEPGNSNARYNLGNMYRKDEGVTQDDTEAALWYRLAAEQGQPKASDPLRLDSKRPIENEITELNELYQCSQFYRSYGAHDAANDIELVSALKFDTYWEGVFDGTVKPPSEDRFLKVIYETTKRASLLALVEETSSYATALHFRYLTPDWRRSEMSTKSQTALRGYAGDFNCEYYPPSGNEFPDLLSEFDPNQIENPEGDESLIHELEDSRDLPSDVELR